MALPWGSTSFLCKDLGKHWKRENLGPDLWQNAPSFPRQLSTKFWLNTPSSSCNNTVVSVIQDLLYTIKCCNIQHISPRWYESIYEPKLGVYLPYIYIAINLHQLWWDCCVVLVGSPKVPPPCPLLHSPRQVLHCYLCVWLCAHTSKTWLSFPGPAWEHGASVVCGLVNSWWWRPTYHLSNAVQSKCFLTNWYQVFRSCSGMCFLYKYISLIPCFESGQRTVGAWWVDQLHQSLHPGSDGHWCDFAK